MNVTTYAADIAKNVFQVHWVNPETGEISRRKLSRTKFAEFFASRQPAKVVLEACGSAHHWGRKLGTMGHEVELLPARQVRAFVQGSKDDAADARAIWIACQHTDIRRVPLKSCDQQSMQFLHRWRTHWVSVRTATINAVRSMLYEFGVVLPQGRNHGLKVLAEQRADIDQQLPAVVKRMLDLQLQALHEVDCCIQNLEAELEAAQRQSAVARRLREIPGIGLLGASALAAMLGTDAKGWRNGRDFSCCLGLPPRHTGTGGKVRMGGMSKRGDPYLRTLLISGARSLMMQKHPSPWIVNLMRRRPANVVAVAVANKLARTAWALIAHDRKYDPKWMSAACPI